MKPMRPLKSHEFAQYVANYPATADSHPPNEVWLNENYRCLVYRGDRYQLQNKDGTDTGFPRVIWLSICRHDKEPIRDWRSLQQIKNDVVGKHHEGLELFPREDRLVDEANQFHLWVLEEPGQIIPVGYLDRRVSGKKTAEAIGAVQRPLGQNQ